MRLSDARTTDEILAAAANFVWYEAHKTSCPTEQIPTEAALCGWLGLNIWGNGDGSAWLTTHLGTQTLHMVRLQNGVMPQGYLDVGNLDTFTLLDAHADWLTLPAPRPPHPLAGLARAWQQRPAPVDANTRSDRTLPLRLGMVERNDARAGRLFTPALHAADGGQTILPGFGTYFDMPTPALPLALYDLGVGDSVERRGRGAPLALRLWIEGVLSVPLVARRLDTPVSMQVTLRELLAQLYPGGRPSPARYWPRLMAAVEALESPAARIPWEDPATGKGGLRRVVSVSNIPRGPGALDDDVRIVVDLPPGAADGPTVSPNLALWGVKAAAPYRALIGLAFRWWEPGKTRRPVGRGRRRFWYQSDNPADYGEPLTDAEAAALCFPTSTRAERRKLAFEARQVLKTLVEAGEAREVAGRLLPPKGNG